MGNAKYTHIQHIVVHKQERSETQLRNASGSGKLFTDSFRQPKNTEERYGFQIWIQYVTVAATGF